MTFDLSTYFVKFFGEERTTSAKYLTVIEWDGSRAIGLTPHDDINTVLEDLEYGDKCSIYDAGGNLVAARIDNREILRQNSRSANCF